MGVTFRPSCGAVAGWSWDCSGPKPTKASDDASEVVSVDPVTLVAAPPDCVGMEFDDAVAEARALLLVGASQALESELWTGTALPGQPHLASADAEVLAGGSPVSAHYALAALGQYLASCGNGARGMIHATPLLVEMWSDWLVEDGDVLRTRTRGDIVVAGSGYAGTSPAGAAPATGQNWAYATSTVEVRLGDAVVVPDTEAEALDRKSNRLAVYAEQEAVAYFGNCCHAGILAEFS